MLQGKSFLCFIEIKSKYVQTTEIRKKPFICAGHPLIQSGLVLRVQGHSHHTPPGLKGMKEVEIWFSRFQSSPWLKIVPWSFVQGNIPRKINWEINDFIKQMQSSKMILELGFS